MLALGGFFKQEEVIRYHLQPLLDGTLNGFCLPLVQLYHYTNYGGADTDGWLYLQQLGYTEARKVDSAVPNI